MKASRLVLLAAILVVAAAGAWYFFTPRGTVATQNLTIYYAKADGSTLGTWSVSVRPRAPGESDAEHLHNVALYAAVQAIAGPPSEVSAVRFPSATHVLNVTVLGSTATVDLSGDVASSAGGSYEENGEFKGLVYTLTGIPSINAVQILVAGRKVETLPGGHLELDQPLHRSDW
ncbi:MAG TPA: GerMN domain-containing protein [Candidatus Baltobacteraceae bacterium]|nr:GerMN domain-containing protein [Candidatus Baltobacteraceae bacterium]